jgi:uncharacterized membrane protein
MDKAEEFVARWQAAGLLDEPTAAAIREWEWAQARPAGRQWQVLLALLLGGILLGAGVLLFVAAHWDKVSPGNRLLLVLAMLAFFHGLGLATRNVFDGFATAMHALGTVASGAAIALIGQIFNMQEHWPAAVLMWALCAGAGWYLLRDQFQQVLTLLLVPTWMVCEFSYRVGPYLNSDIYVARVVAVIAAICLGAFVHARQRVVFGILFGAGSVALPIAIGVLTEGWQSYSFMPNRWGFVPLGWRVATMIFLAALAGVGAWIDRRSLVPVAAAVGLGYALPWLRTTITEPGFDGKDYTHTGAGLAAYVLVGMAAVGLVVWGVYIGSKALVNYGIAAFALSVMWFYFSSLMDKLGRSLGLIVLGALFLAVGWALERTRRRLVERMDANRAEATV